MNNTANFDDGGIEEVDRSIDRDIFWNELMDYYLTPSEVIVLVLTLEGWTVENIAAHLGISVSGVNSHLTNIKTKGRNLAESEDLVL